MSDELGDFIETITHNIAAMGVSSQVSKMGPQLYWFHIEDRLTKLFSRIETIRQLNYRSQVDLEGDQIKAALLWTEVDPSLKEKNKSRVEDLLKKVNDLQSGADSNYTSGRSPQGDHNKLANLRKQIAAYKAEVADFYRQIQQDLAPLPSLLMSIEQRVFTAETALDLTTMASFKLKEDEALLFALKAKDMNKKTEGVLTFTNQRMLFESLPTKKKERQLVLCKPIDSMAKIIKDKMGTFTPEGMVIKFKNPSDPELKFATTKLSGDADRAVENFDDLASGKVVEDLKSGINVAMRRRFKELAAMYFPGASFCRGTCKECGTVVSKAIKTYILDGGPIMGLFDCPKCHKPFKATLAPD